jgi:hypothetical protein
MQDEWKKVNPDDDPVPVESTSNFPPQNSPKSSYPGREDALNNGSGPLLGGPSRISLFDYSSAIDVTTIV